MNRLHPPGFIKLLLHYHTTAEQPVSSIVHTEWTNQMIEDGLIETRVDKKSYATTDKGSAYVDLLCSTPYPVNRWVDPRVEPNG